MALIVAEAVMMGLAPVLGRGEAHHVVKHACDIAQDGTIVTDRALSRDPPRELRGWTGRRWSG